MSHKKARNSSVFFKGINARLAAVLLGSVSVVTTMAVASPVMAQQSQSYAIPAGSLDDALARFGTTSGIQVIYNSSITTGLRSGGANGPLRAEAALDRILNGTGLVHRFSSPRSVTISRAGGADPGTDTGANAGTTLQPIVLQGDQPRGPIDGYVARQSFAGTKTNTSIMQTSRSVEVVGQKELDQRAPASVVDAVRYSAGVTTGAFGYDPRFDQIYVRGFGLTTFGDFKDGLRQMTSSYGTFRTDPYALERIDIVKGPASALYGQSTPGGLIDRVSKRPSTTPVREVMTRIDSTGRYQAGFDYGDVLPQDDAWRYRVVGLGRIGEGSYDVEDQRFMIAPSVTYAPDADTSLTVLAHAQHDVTDANVAALNRSGQVYDIRASDPDYDTQKVWQYQLGYEFEHRFVDTWTFRNSTRIGYMETEAKYLTGGVTGGGWKTDGTGRAYYARGTYGLDDRMFTAQTDANLLGEFDTGELSHKLLVGIDFQSSSSKYKYGSSAASSQYDLYLDNPVYGRSGPAPAYTAGRDTDVTQTGIYLQDQIKFLDN